MTLYFVLRLLVINISMWFVIHFSVSVGLLKLPLRFFRERSKLHFLFRSYNWEKDGEIWDKFFRVKDWKDRLPDGASLFNLGYKKKQLPSSKKKDIVEFIQETKRAELTHWLILLPAPLFFLWNPRWAGSVNVLYGLTINLPFILIQRYNRPRLERIKKLKQNRMRKTEEEDSSEKTIQAP